MSIVYPLTMPGGSAVRIRVVSFDLTPFQSATPTIGGAAAPLTYAEPVWVASFTTPRLLPAEIDQWQAWLDSLRGMEGTFWALDPDKRLPRAYLPGGFGGLVRATYASGAPAFNGETTVRAVDSSRTVVTIGSLGSGTNQTSALPAGFDLRAGDRLTIDRVSGGAKRSYHSILAVTQATNASGQWIGVIEPPMPLDASVGALVRLENPVCKMRMTKRDKPTKDAGNKVRPQVVSFEAMEDLVA